MKTTFLAIFATLLFNQISGHGYLYVPPSRNYVAYLAGQDYNKNELNGEFDLPDHGLLTTSTSSTTTKAALEVNKK